MNSKTKKWLGIGSAIAIAIGTGGMFLSGATVQEASGIVGLAFSASTAIGLLIAGIKAGMK